MIWYTEPVYPSKSKHLPEAVENPTAKAAVMTIPAHKTSIVEVHVLFFIYDLSPGCLACVHMPQPLKLHKAFALREKRQQKALRHRASPWAPSIMIRVRALALSCLGRSHHATVT
mmetsp:Transcript_29962/g.54587  ORF Transcript_29962/g.54587 Transcript_29962/m.54587 type:complete len:115 (+) Transcript_29962:930-1274(+)